MFFCLNRFAALPTVLSLLEPIVLVQPSSDLLLFGVSPVVPLHWLRLDQLCSSPLELILFLQSRSPKLFIASHMVDVLEPSKGK